MILTGAVFPTGIFLKLDVSQPACSSGQHSAVTDVTVCVEYLTQAPSSYWLNVAPQRDPLLEIEYD